LNFFIADTAKIPAARSSICCNSTCCRGRKGHFWYQQASWKYLKDWIMRTLPYYTFQAAP